jgi:5-methylcytosine-specific restriction protein A
MNYNDKFSGFYASKEWQKLREHKFNDANGLCENCLAKGIIKEGVEVHHKIPIEKDWSKRLDYNNLILLCKECHQSEHERSGNLNEFLKIWDKGE